MVGFENTQVQQAQDRADSTTLLGLGEVHQEAQNPPVKVNLKETFPIPSVIQVNRDPSQDGPYEREMGLPDFITYRGPKSNTPRRDGPHPDLEEDEGQRAQGSPDSSIRGQLRPILSIMDMDPDPYNGPYEPHEEHLYAVLTTNLGRDEARCFREQVRNSGWGAFSVSPWTFEWHQGATRFRHKDRGKTATSITHGNIEVFKQWLQQEMQKTVKKRRRMMIVQSDGGEVSVEGLVPERNHTSTFAVLEIFEEFEM